MFAKSGDGDSYHTITTVGYDESMLIRKFTWIHICRPNELDITRFYPIYQWYGALLRHVLRSHFMCNIYDTDIFEELYIHIYLKEGRQYDVKSSSRKHLVLKNLLNLPVFNTESRNSLCNETWSRDTTQVLLYLILTNNMYLRITKQKYGKIHVNLPRNLLYTSLLYTNLLRW